MFRSLFIQGSWNYETLIGTGFAFTAIPALRAVYAQDDEALEAAVRRHTDVFNSHPYMATVAVGAVAQLEAEQVDPRIVARFKSALRGSLGALGDQLVWSSWRPASALLGLTILLLGGPWWLAVGAFLVVYNAMNFGLRTWGWRIGSTAGLEVGRVLRDAPLQALGRRATQAGALLGGLAMTLAAAGAVSDVWAAAIDGLAVIGGIWLGSRARHGMVLALTVVLLVGTLLGLMK